MLRAKKIIKNTRFNQDYYFLNINNNPQEGTIFTMKAKYFNKHTFKISNKTNQGTIFTQRSADRRQWRPLC